MSEPLSGSSSKRSLSTVGWLGCFLAIGVMLMILVVESRRNALPRQQDSDIMVRIAGVGGTDYPVHERIRLVLEGNGIPVAMWGSRFYNVTVIRSEAKSAIKILRKDAKERGYWIHFGDFSDTEPLSDWVYAPYVQILERVKYAASTDLGACLRHPDVATLARGYPQIDRILYQRIPLFESCAKDQMIEEVRLEQYLKPGTRKRRTTLFQIFGDQGEVHIPINRVVGEDE
jgi:hypothetical protein